MPLFYIEVQEPDGEWSSLEIEASTPSEAFALAREELLGTGCVPKYAREEKK